MLEDREGEMLINMVIPNGTEKCYGHYYVIYGISIVFPWNWVDHKSFVTSLPWIFIIIQWIT